jgi:hypothetical protein
LNEESSTTPTTTTRTNIAIVKTEPRSLARTGSKRNVRQVRYLEPRLAELKDCSLTPELSFFIDQVGDVRGPTLSKENLPEENVAIMLDRVRNVYDLFKATFDRVSGIYIGKSTNLRVRFNHHMRTKKKMKEALALVGVGLFTDADVNDLDRNRWQMSCEVLGFQYERLLTKAVANANLPTFSEKQEPGGGGRCGGENTMECIVYMLVSFANNG